MRELDGSKLIERHLAEGSSIEAEMALLVRQGEDKRSIFEQRLRAMDHYLSKPDPSVSDVDEAATQIGVSRRQFYRLLTKMRSLGPVRGLLPGLQNVARSSVATEGLAEPIEAILVQEMMKDPTIKIARLESLIMARAEERGFERPSEWKLRRRIHALRASGLTGSNLEFGCSIVIDQIALDLPVRDRGRASYATVTLIIDRNTRMIAGATVTLGDGIGLGIQGALADVRRRVRGLNAAGLQVARRLERLTWIVPPGLEKHAAAASGIVDGRRRAIEAAIIDKGPRRHGELILRLLGDRLGIYNFRTRLELGVDAERALDAATNDDLEFASRVIGHCVDSWNKKLLEVRPHVGSVDATNARRLDRIAKELTSFFQPVFESIESGFRPSHL